MNFFLSPFLSSVKVNNNTLSFLKIFFERANKISNTIASFGNVFKNSKWADLKTQNIKKSFAKQWFFFAVLSTTLFILLVNFRSTPLLQLVTVFHILKQSSFEVLYDIYFFILALGLNLKSPKNYTNSSFNQISQFSQSDSLTTSTNFRFTQLNPVLPAGDLRPVNNFKVITQLNRLPANLTNYPSTQLSQPLNTHSLLNISFSLTPDYTGLVLNNSSYILSTKLNPSFKNLNTVTRGLIPNSSPLERENPLSLDHVTTQLITVTKQYRWLTRNFFNTSQLNKNSNAITSSKTLIGSNVSDQDTTKTNVWLSNNLNTLSSDYLNSNNLNNWSGSSTYNTFEYSRFFTNMRFFYLINFRNLMPKKNDMVNQTPSNSQNYSPHGLAYFSQEKSFINSDLGFSTMLLNPEYPTLNINSLNQSTVYWSQSNNLLSTQNTSDVLTELTLESIDSMNTTLSNRSEYSVNLNSTSLPHQGFKS